MGAELSFDLVRNLLEIIQRMRPGGKEAALVDRARAARGGSKPRPARPTADNPLPGLSVRDDVERAKALTREIYGDNPITANMADDPRFIERRDDDRGGDRGRDRDRDDRGRDRRGGSRDRGGRDDEGAEGIATVAAADPAATATTTAAGARVHPPPPRPRSRPAIPRWAASTAVGSPTSWDFGCFVELVDFSRRHEGLVHVSMISANKGVNAREQVRKDQSVWVKVTTRSSTRMALSMRDVDQRTGDDLLGGGGGADARAAPARRTVPRRNRALLCGVCPAFSCRRKIGWRTRGGDR